MLDIFEVLKEFDKRCPEDAPLALFHYGEDVYGLRSVPNNWMMVFQRDVFNDPELEIEKVIDSLVELRNKIKEMQTKRIEELLKGNLN